MASVGVRVGRTGGGPSTGKSGELFARWNPCAASCRRPAHSRLYLSKWWYLGGGRGGTRSASGVGSNVPLNTLG